MEDFIKPPEKEPQDQGGGQLEGPPPLPPESLDRLRAAYLQENAEKFLGSFRKLDAGKWGEFDGAAFLMSVCWLVCYRLYGVAVAIAILNFFLRAFLEGANLPDGLVTLVAVMISSLAVGFLAHKWLRTDVDNAIKEALKQSGGLLEEAEERLKSRAPQIIWRPFCCLLWWSSVLYWAIGRQVAALAFRPLDAKICKLRNLLLKIYRS